MNTRMAALGCGLAFALAGCAGSGSELTTAGVLGEEKKPGNLAMQEHGHGPRDPGGLGRGARRQVRLQLRSGQAEVGLPGHEAQAGLGVDELAKTEKVYGVAYSGVAKGVQGDSAYCTDRKSAEIKSDLTRHLAGDFSPPRRARRPTTASGRASSTTPASRTGRSSARRSGGTGKRTRAVSDAAWSARARQRPSRHMAAGGSIRGADRSTMAPHNEKGRPR